MGTSECLLDDSVRFADRAKAAGLNVSLEIWDDMIHMFQLFASWLPEGQDAISKIGAFIQNSLS